MPCENNAGQNDNINGANMSFENVVNCSHLGTVLTNQNCLHEKLKQVKFKERYKSSVQNRLSFSLLSRNTSI
jgi:hypothetical protein